MSIRAAVYDLLNDVSSSVFPLAAPQETTTAYAVYSITTDPIRTQSGIQVYNLRLTVDIYANTRDACLTLASSFFSGLENKSGSYSDQTIMVCNWTSESEDYIPDLKKWNITQDYEIKIQ